MRYTNEEKQQTGIYAIINRLDGKIYIGSAAVSFAHRWNVHKAEFKNNENSKYLQNAWNKYGEINFEYRILEVVEKPFPFDKKIHKNWLTDIEQIYLDTYQPYRRHIGYNICPVAGSQLGTQHTEESKKKMSEAAIGRKHTAETKAKIGEASKGKQYWKGKKHTEEAKAKVSTFQKGKSKSKESIAKRSETRSKVFCQLISPEGEVFTLKGYATFCKERGLLHTGIGMVLRGKRNHHKGWTGHSITEEEYYSIIKQAS